jgi:prepilin-type N-terminal cleavage/methylation domain-containing protein
MSRSGPRRGYTIVELMMAIAVLAIGVTGIISMQKVTMVANSHARDLAVANQIAGAWLDHLATDAMYWNRPSRAGEATNRDQTKWLGDGNVTGAWFQPAYDDGDGSMLFGPAFDALGNPLPASEVAQAVYCTHVRLSWLFNENGAMAGNGLIRAEVRVFWLREGGPGLLNGAAVCATTNTPAAIGAAIENFHFVYQTGAVRQNRL